MHHFIVDVVAMTDMRAKRLREQDEKGDGLQRCRGETEYEMAIEK